MSIGDKLATYTKKDMYPFHMPGHKRRLIADSSLKSLYEIDITEIDDFDNLHDATGIIKEAQDLCAKVFGAYKSYFLVNGTTSGILSAVCGTVHEGDVVIMARNCHKCVYNAVMLSGADVRYIYPEQEAYVQVCAGITACQVEEAIKEVMSGKTSAGDDFTGNILVVLTSPTYEGIISDIGAIADTVHKYNATLLVDAAHGAHLGFSKGFAQSAIKSGADIEVISVHKTLPAPTQTSVLHIAQNVRSMDRIEQMLKVFQTSSPSYPLMAGIDACIRLLDRKKDSLFSEYEERLNDFYAVAESLESLGVLSKDKLTRAGSIDFDYGKIVVYDKSQKYSGRQLYQILRETYHIQPEMASGSYVVLMTSIADDAKGFNCLKKALSEIDKSLTEGTNLPQKRNIIAKICDRLIGKYIKNSLFSGDDKEDYLSRMARWGMIDDIADSSIPVVVDSAVNTKTAMWSHAETIPVELAGNRISADYIMFYPPGIPIAVPGERLSDAIIDEILEGRENGLLINGLSSDGEIRVLWEKSSI